MVSIVCTKPKGHDLSAELWTISGLAQFVSERAKDAGFPRLARAGKSTVWRILDENQSSPTASATTWKNVIRSSIARCKKS